MVRPGDRLRAHRGPARTGDPVPRTIGLGANMAVRRDAFAQIGLFDEDLGPGGRLITGEECELALRALSAGIDVVRDPSFNVLHWGARPVAGGAARDLVNFGFFALGAGYGKHLRGGDWRAAAVVGHETAVVGNASPLLRSGGSARCTCAGLRCCGRASRWAFSADRAFLA